VRVVSKTDGGLSDFARESSISQVRFFGITIACHHWQVPMSLVRLLGFTTLQCGCVSGRYREMGTNREITYIEEKGTGCAQAGHQRNQPVSADRVAHGFRSTDVRAS
jgi:hypothetical protein